MFSISRFQSVLKALPRPVFDRAVQACGSDRYSKRFDSWTQMVAMLFGHFSGASSLRMIEASFNSQPQHHYHLGVAELRRSTLADANAKRSAEPFAAVAHALMSQVHRSLRHEGEALLYLMDSTSITLKGRTFDEWTALNSTRHTQGIKVHVVYAKAAQAPLQYRFSAANTNDVTAGTQFTLEASAIYVFDKGYCDYNWWAKIDSASATFVTRFKRNAGLKRTQSRPIEIPDRDTILADEIVQFACTKPGGGRSNHYTQPLRRITVARPDRATPLILATNDLTSPAKVIAGYYKDRWGIELFFKWIKQHLKIKQAFGRSENAVKIQILCALIAYLLLVIYRKTHAMSTNLWAILSELRVTLFARPASEIATHRRRMRQRQELENKQPGLFA